MRRQFGSVALRAKRKAPPKAGNLRPQSTFVYGQEHRFEPAPQQLVAGQALDLPRTVPGERNGKQERNRSQLVNLPDRVKGVIFAYVGENVAKRCDDLLQAVRRRNRHTSAFVQELDHW